MTPFDRLQQLLADRATEGLGADDAAELDRLLHDQRHPDPDEFDLAAAAVDLAVGPPPADEVPLDLVARITADAAAFFAPPDEALPIVAPLPDPGPAAVELPPRRWPWLTVAGWATAACLAGVVGWLAWPREGVAEPTVAQRRDALAQAGATRYAGPGGRVDWDGAKQVGYLEVRGLPPNDPARRQYQLWIVDAGRPDQEPVDGGVFDVGPDGSALVPVRAALPVRDAAAFAVTDEAAGGVVVSRQPHLVVLTKGG